MMTTSVSPAMTTRLIKQRWPTSQENPHKWSERSCRAAVCRVAEQRTLNGTVGTGRSSYICDVWTKKRKSNPLTFQVEMCYVSRLKVSCVRTGLSTFLPFHEDSRNNDSDAADVMQ